MSHADVQLYNIRCSISSLSCEKLPKPLFVSRFIAPILDTRKPSMESNYIADIVSRSLTHQCHRTSLVVLPSTRTNTAQLYKVLAEFSNVNHHPTHGFTISSGDRLIRSGRIFASSDTSDLASDRQDYSASLYARDPVFRCTMRSSSISETVFQCFPICAMSRLLVEAMAVGLRARI
jgi:hypothetical protein